MKVCKKPYKNKETEIGPTNDSVHKYSEPRLLAKLDYVFSFLFIISKGIKYTKKCIK